MKALGTVLGGFIGVALGIWALLHAVALVGAGAAAGHAGPYHNLILIGIGALGSIFGVPIAGAVFSFIFNLITPGK